ncbi:DNA polymerase III subunit delta' [Polynucleobacter paneuropaeus]|uniref:DNA polymerase III subunit delta n=1 Tax=Polynucleobacter paneuropaeus TaxID=2527775 RepID=A0A2Z4JSM2_9BURK|nr:DNA polymerase III subunit delta' [Polynucleobacter paneuropaeus]AWW49797.1 DNA polymerase III subunit delta' [Polynucleobacter paneuropaeus]QWD04763.1 DNA polymerase III subunit delta' [Polynucleobacter paneuropaeus]
MLNSSTDIAAPSIPPWLEPLWNSVDLQNFPHAVLVHGQSGIGKFEFAIELAKALLCESTATSKPCNACEACHWFDSGNHPDFIALAPETHQKRLPKSDLDLDAEAPKKKTASADDEEASDKKEKKNIAIEDARKAIEGLSIGTHRGGNRVILIYPLESLRPDSANTLLKSLEEPPAQTIFLLLADRLERVLPTIRSRCRLIAAPRPDRETGLSWLKDRVSKATGGKLNEDELQTIYDEQGGAPFSVFNSLLARYHQDDKDELSIAIQASRILLQGLSQGSRINSLELAEKIHKSPMGPLLTSAQRWVADLLAVIEGGNARYFPKHQPGILTLSKQARLAKLLRFWKLLTITRRHENHPLANRVQLEALLSQYQQIFED